MVHIFIINPFAGRKTFADDLREKLSKIENLNYFVFNTRYEGYETEIVKRIQHIFEGEELRFYCCGGSGTMRNMLNGFDDLSTAEVAFFPCGLSNDFLKMFGKDMPRFHQIEELIYGDVVKVDYIKSNYGISLNTLSTGLDAITVRKMNEYRILGKINENIPYILSIIYSLLFSKAYEFEITVDDKVIRDKSIEVFFGNGCIFGATLFFDEHTSIDDGKMIYRFIPKKNIFSLLNTLMAITGKKYDTFDNIMRCGECTKIKFRRTDGVPFTINQDGDLFDGVTECEAEVIRKGLRFVVPKGVKVE